MPSPVPALASARHAERAFAVTLAAYLLSAAALVAVGVTPTIGWTLLPLLLFALSFAYGLARGLFLVGTLLRGRPRLVPPVGIALGFAVTWCYHLQSPVFLLCCLFLLAILGVDCRRDREPLIYPAVSPCVYYPESFRAGYEGTMAAALGHSLAADYVALRRGLPLSGFGYFVAIPSMHVAMAVILQASLVGSRAHFWTFLPVNLLLVSSTVVLGQHYLIDVPAGVLVGLVVLPLGGRHRLPD